MDCLHSAEGLSTGVEQKFKQLLNSISHHHQSSFGWLESGQPGEETSEESSLAGAHITQLAYLPNEIISKRSESGQRRQSRPKATLPQWLLHSERSSPVDQKYLLKQTTKF